MEKKRFSILILVLFLCNSCATKALWECTDPDEYVKIKFTEIHEQELREKGAKYIRDDKRNVFYVEKNSFEKLTDYTYRLLGAPVAIVVDAGAIAVTVVAVGILGMAGEFERQKNCLDDPECRYSGKYP